MLRPAPTLLVDFPTLPSDVQPDGLDLDEVMAKAHVRKALRHALNNLVPRPGAEKHAKNAVEQFLRSMKARGTLGDYSVVEATWASGEENTFDEVSGLPAGTAPGDPYLTRCPQTGQELYGGLIVYSDGEGGGLVFRGHEGTRGTGAGTVKVQVSVRLPSSVDYVVITAQAGDSTDPLP